MEWFKFYGQEFLTDPKMMSLTAVEKSLWLTILCLANNTNDGVIKYIDETKIMFMTNVNALTDEWDENKNFINHFEELGMVKRIDNGISVINFVTKQNKSLSAYERVKRYRERQKAKETNDNVVKRINDNDREDKRRIEKNREDIEKEIIKKKTHTLDEVGDLEIEEIALKYSVPRSFVISKLDDLKNWHEKNPAKNKYTDYKAALRDWVKRDAMNIQKEAHGQSKIAYINDEDTGGVNYPVQDQTDQRGRLDNPATSTEQHFESIGGGG